MYMYGKFSVNEDGYLDFKDDECFELRIRDVPDCFEVEWREDEDDKWEVGYIYYDLSRHRYNVHESFDLRSECIPLNYDMQYRIRKNMYFMLDAYREDCRARDKIFYADGSYLSYQRKVVK